MASLYRPDQVGACCGPRCGGGNKLRACFRNRPVPKIAARPDPGARRSAARLLRAFEAEEEDQAIIEVLAMQR